MGVSKRMNEDWTAGNDTRWPYNADVNDSPYARAKRREAVREAEKAARMVRHSPAPETTGDLFGAGLP